ncbi:uncharacterized protein [Chaetodon trifascialis]|uniref:uncharacterized protein n=1 Tax=Chaetodon trifascialis TaxID=109706 RepID=UPI003993DB75
MAPVVYSRDQLLALRNTAVRPEERPDVPRELRRRTRGCRAGIKRCDRRRAYRPTLPSVIMGNMRSLSNKMDELAALTRHEQDYWRCSLLLLTETWLGMQHTDATVALDGFSLVRADQTEKSASPSSMADQEPWDASRQRRPGTQFSFVTIGQVKSALPPPASALLTDFQPGDWVVTKDLRRKQWYSKRWQGPFQVLLTKHTAVKIAESNVGSGQPL